MEPVRVRVLIAPRLLADLIAVALTSAWLHPWAPGDPPAEVTVTTPELAAGADTPVTVVLPARLDEPLMIQRGHDSQLVTPSEPYELHDLLVRLAYQAEPHHDSRATSALDAGSRRS